MTRPPVLYIFSGLPGTGKTTLSQLLAKRLNAAYVRIDTVEQALRDLCALDVEGEGYSLAYRIAADNLRLGMSVVADSCNPVQLTRDAWEKAATDSAAGFVNIEVICSDKVEHRARIETRAPTVPGLRLPTWTDVLYREYHPWSGRRIIIDTSGKTMDACTDNLVSKLKTYGC